MNYFAILCAAVSSFMLGGLWYSAALFGNTWSREAGMGECKPGERHPAKVFGISFLFALLAAVAYAWLMPVPASAGMAAVQGLTVGACFVAASFGVNYQFANRSLTLLAIDGGYHSAQFLIYGLVLGLWR